MPSISVLISVYKSEDPGRFDRALESIWSGQTLRPDQIVLIEDGPLGTELDKVVSNWKGRLADRLTLIVNQTNLGLTKSLNKGIQEAEGDYIVRMDSDDLSTPDRFEKQVAYMESHPDIAASSGSVAIYDGDDNFLYTKKFPLTDAEARRWICKSSPLSHPCAIIRRSVFSEGISYDERYRTTQDLALWFDLMAAGYKVGNIEDTLLKFRYDDGHFKRRSLEKSKNECRIYLDGIRRLHGPVTWKYIYPLARYCFRLMPRNLVKMIYFSKLKNKFS